MQKSKFKSLGIASNLKHPTATHFELFLTKKNPKLHPPLLFNIGLCASFLDANGKWVGTEVNRTAF